MRFGDGLNVVGIELPSGDGSNGQFCARIEIQRVLHDRRSRKHRAGVKQCSASAADIAGSVIAV